MFGYLVTMLNYTLLFNLHLVVIPLIYFRMNREWFRQIAIYIALILAALHFTFALISVYTHEIFKIPLHKISENIETRKDLDGL
ncbi:MAG: hypothetical protein AAFR46_13945 [Pseudomonadota bacterium]